MWLKEGSPDWNNHAWYIPCQKASEIDRSFPLPELFSNLGYTLDTMAPRGELAIQDLQDMDDTGLLILDIRLWNPGLHHHLFHNVQDTMKKWDGMLWFCPEDAMPMMQIIPDNSLRDLVFLHHDAGKRTLVPLLRIAYEAGSCPVWNLWNVDMGRAAMDSFQEALLVMLPDGFILQANQTALALLEARLGELLYSYMDRFYQVIPLEEDDLRFLSGPHHCRLRLAGGRELKVSYRDIVSESTRGWQVHLVYIRDVGREIAVLSDMDKARREAQKAAKTKSDFLANISHELRTPLNSILGMTDLAMQMAENKEQEEYLRILQISGNSLLQLITSMLDYIKLESGVINLKEKAFPVSEIFDCLSAQFAIQCHNKGLGFHIVADEQAPAFFVGDETRVKQILMNLASNALKFTPRGEIVIRYRDITPHDASPVAPGADGSDAMTRAILEFQVLDTGIGIDPVHQEDIFHPFTQLNVSDQTNTPGTGIGLTITRLLVEAMGGHISVVSEPGRGAIFTVTCQLLKGAIRRQTKNSVLLADNDRIVAVGDSWGWFDSLQGALGVSRDILRFCRHPAEVAEALEKARSSEVLLILQGSYPESEGLFAVLGNPRFSAILHRKHILTLRLSVDAEMAWHSAPFPYKIVYEPLRSTSLHRVLLDLEMEMNREDRDATYGQYHSPYDLELAYVEDESLNRVATSRILSEAGHRVQAFADGMEMLAYLQDHQPDLILLDIEIPVINGYEIATRIRSGEFGSGMTHTPIIALTAHDSMEDKNQADLVGIDAFLGKPFSPQTLLVVLDRVWERFLDGKTGRKHDTMRKAGIWDQVREAVRTKNWDAAQDMVQQYREDNKSQLLKEQNEQTFRLLLGIRRQEAAQALTIIDTLQRQGGKGAEYEDSRR